MCGTLEIDCVNGETLQLVGKLCSRDTKFGWIEVEYKDARCDIGQPRIVAIGELRFTFPAGDLDRFCRAAIRYCDGRKKCGDDTGDLAVVIPPRMK